MGSDIVQSSSKVCFLFSFLQNSILSQSLSLNETFTSKNSIKTPFSRIRVAPHTQRLPIPFLSNQQRNRNRERERERERERTRNSSITLVKYLGLSLPHFLSISISLLGNALFIFKVNLYLTLSLSLSLSLSLCIHYSKYLFSLCTFFCLSLHTGLSLRSHYSMSLSLGQAYSIPRFHSPRYYTSLGK